MPLHWPAVDAGAVPRSLIEDHPIVSVLLEARVPPRERHVGNGHGIVAAASDRGHRVEQREFGAPAGPRRDDQARRRRKPGPVVERGRARLGAAARRGETRGQIARSITNRPVDNSVRSACWMSSHYFIFSYLN